MTAPPPKTPVAAGGTGPHTDLTPLRDAIRYARATGWDHFTVGPDYDRAHVWRHGGRRVELYDGELNIERPQTRPCSWAPASLAEAVAVLEAAALLPPAWSRP